MRSEVGTSDNRRPRWRRWCAVTGVAAGLALGVAPASAVAATQPPPIEEFVPIDQLPDEDRLPAAPFLVAAYSIVWLAAFGYFWLLSRRLSVVERELADLSGRRGGVGDDPGATT